jgi:hypothetical protein
MVDSIVAAGYEIEAVVTLSDAAIKEVFPTGEPFPSRVFITLQQWASVAVCEMAPLSWLSLTDAQIKDTTRCFMRWSFSCDVKYGSEIGEN